MDDLFPNEMNRRPGFRLHKLEVYNWGTFDSTTGSVHLVRPEGQTALLVGQNESGKSTLVDALLTLLVRPVVRNYNVAAGGHKQDRDERSYIKGAYGRFSRDEDNRGEVRFLRPKGSHYSALLACFYNEDDNQLFTRCRRPVSHRRRPASKRFTAIAPSEKSISDDLGGLKSMDRLRQQIENRGFRATKSYTEYHSWFAKMTGVRPKAMDIFNQTVAVKDIQSLNSFIREHMLESKPWGEKVASLLGHFTQLSEAHQSLVRVRRQAELLEPVAQAGVEYREQASQLDHLQRMVDAADTFFRQKSVEILTPASEALQRDLEAIATRKGRLDQEIGRKAGRMPTPEERDRAGRWRTLAADSVAHPEPPVARGHETRTAAAATMRHFGKRGFTTRWSINRVLPQYRPGRPRCCTTFRSKSQSTRKAGTHWFLNAAASKQRYETRKANSRRLHSVKETCRNGWPR